jgi:L-ascorbate metabolism protein UlaG (beta-lactamase superfamily)
LLGYGKLIIIAFDYTVLLHRPYGRKGDRRPDIRHALFHLNAFRIPMTMDEKSALKAVAALQPKIIIPIHLSLSPRPLFSGPINLRRAFGNACRLRAAPPGRSFCGTEKL